MKIPRRLGRRRAISGIIGAVLLFTMLFTIGTEYFIFVNNANNLETQSLVARGNTLATRLQEGIQVSTSLSSGGYIQFYVNNTGGVTVNMTSLILLSSGGSVLECDGQGLPSGQGCLNTTPALPQLANVGSGAPKSGYVVTNYKYVSGSGTDTLKIVTANGNIFSATYPPTAASLAALSLTSGAIGDIYLEPQTFTYYHVCTSNSGPCNVPASCSTGNPCFLQKQGYGFSIPASDVKNYPLAFSLTVVDYNPSHSNITLDAYTLLTDFFAPSGSSSSGKDISWFIITNSTTSVSSTYSPITLKYDVPVTIVFASSTASSMTPSVYSAQEPTPVADALIFILTHGCKAVKAANCNYQSGTYSQNSPYITSLYY